MNLLFVNHEYPPIGGGAGIAMQHIAEALVQRGHTVHVLTAGLNAGTEIQNGVEIHRIAVPIRDGGLAGLPAWVMFLFRGSTALKRLAKLVQPDVVNAYFLFPSGWLAARSPLSCPLVVTAIGADIHDPTRRVSADNNRLIRQLCGQTLAQTDQLVSSSRDLTHRMKALFPETPCDEISWGIPPLTSGKRDAKDLDLPENRFIIVTLCRLVARKNLNVLLQAFALINREDAFLLLLGDGPEKPRLEALARQLDITDQIQFRGRVSDEDRADLLARAHLFCLPSHHEGFGLVLIESMSVGTPVVASAQGGQQDIIHSGTDGVLIDSGEPQHWAEAIQNLMDHPEDLRNMSEAAQQRAADFSPQKAATRYESLFSALQAPGHGQEEV